MLKRKRKLENAAVIAAPPVPARSDTHNYAKSWAFEIIAGVVALAFFLVFLWMFLEYILDEAGIKVEDFINGVGYVLGASIILGFLFAFAWAGSKIWNQIEDEKHRRQIELEQLRTQHLHLRWKLGTSVDQATGTISPEQKRFNAILVQIVDDVYFDGEFTREGKNAWARNNAGSFIVTGESKAVGAHSQVIKNVSDWLRKQEIVQGPPRQEYWNFDEYPNREAVFNLLRIPVYINRANGTGD